MGGGTAGFNPANIRVAARKGNACCPGVYGSVCEGPELDEPVLLQADSSRMEANSMRNPAWG
jgi:hypothetical protein